MVVRHNCRLTGYLIKTNNPLAINWKK
ncbi:MAG: hypothetical protein DID92_2727744573 [Candidatus Nitrotoga sp. SPKER]|nr:MAG: hypothetical protein DID92_2727744573 [Candidatus Nitrotoga sp. SPKER]